MVDEMNRILSDEKAIAEAKSKMGVLHSPHNKASKTREGCTNRKKYKK